MVDEAADALEQSDVCVNCGTLRFTKDRVEKVRRGQHITAFKRAGVRKARIFLGSTSDDPEREFFLAVGIGAGGVVAARTNEMGWAWGLWAFSALLFAHLCRRTTILMLESEAGAIRVDAEAKLSREEVIAVREKVRNLDWPIC